MDKRTHTHVRRSTRDILVAQRYSRTGHENMLADLKEHQQLSDGQ